MDYCLYPWQHKVWQQLYRAAQANNMPHALLLHGPAQTGKAQFARFVAASLLCQRVSVQGPCESCASCLLSQSGNHPDYTQLAPESGVIKVDQTRALVTGLQTSRHSGSYRVIIIHQADMMNIAAANSLLKTLEEPPERTVIMLVSAQSGRLLATVRSRCQQFSLQPLKADVITWLHQQEPHLSQVDIEARYHLLGHAPLQLIDQECFDNYLQRVDDKLAVLEGKAIRYGIKPTKLIDQLAEWSRLCLWLMKANLGVPLSLEGKYGQRLLRVADRLQPRALAEFDHQLQQSMKQLNDHSSLNEALLLDALWVAWQRLATAS